MPLLRLGQSGAEIAVGSLLLTTGAVVAATGHLVVAAVVWASAPATRILVRVAMRRRAQ